MWVAAQNTLKFVFALLDERLLVLETLVDPVLDLGEALRFADAAFNPLHLRADHVHFNLLGGHVVAVHDTLPLRRQTFVY